MQASIGSARIAVAKFNGGSVELGAFRNELELVLAFVNNGSLSTDPNGYGHGSRGHLEALVTVKGLVDQLVDTISEDIKNADE